MAKIIGIADAFMPNFKAYDYNGIFKRVRRMINPGGKDGGVMGLNHLKHKEVKFNIGARIWVHRRRDRRDAPFINVEIVRK